MTNIIFYVLGFVSASVIVASMLLLYGAAQELQKERDKHDR
jgi:hypothetical protein